MDYGKVADILSQINTDAIELETVEYLPSNFWVELVDILSLSDMISGGWAEPTEMGKAQLRFAWATLCDLRDLNPEVMYDSVEAFFEAQTKSAEVIPINRGK